MTKEFATVSVPFFPHMHRRLGAWTLGLAFVSALSAQAAMAQVQGPVIPHAHGMGNTGLAAPQPTPQPSAPQTAQQQPSATGKPSAAIPASTAVAPVSSEAVSQLQQPPKQAVIETQTNTLTIRADNASLTQTLQRIADKTGMHLEGVSGDQRVFGNFGPGTPRDVLSTLLNGTGYNILMIGALDNGVPRQLILSQKKADSSSQGANASHQQQSYTAPDDDASDPSADDQPTAMPPPHGGPDGTGPGIRTPQQMLQQMQQMRQQADQQQQQPSQQ